MQTRELTVMTANLAGGMRAKKGHLEPRKTALDFIRLVQANTQMSHFMIIAVQEAYAVWESLAGPAENTAQALAEDWPDLHSFFAPTLDSNVQPHDHKWKRPAFEDFKKLQQGNAIATNLRLGNWPWMKKGTAKCPMNIMVSRPMLFSTGDRNTEPRYVFFAPFIIGSQLIYFMAVHLSTISGEDRHDSNNPVSERAHLIRSKEIDNIRRLIFELRQAEENIDAPHAPIIIAGDFNETPEAIGLSRGITDYFKRAEVSWNQPSENNPYTHIGHKICVDHIFYSDPSGNTLQVEPGTILNIPGIEEVTDHYPVIVKFLIKQE